LTVQVACPEESDTVWHNAIGEPPCEKATVPWVFPGETLPLLLAADTVAVSVTDWPYTDDDMGFVVTVVVVGSTTSIVELLEDGP
jgi:hypothetical protein